MQLRGGLQKLELGANLLNLYLIISAFLNIIRNALEVEDARKGKDIVIGKTTVKACSEFLNVAFVRAVNDVASASAKRAELSFKMFAPAFL